jgi:hypothetical protein
MTTRAHAACRRSEPIERHTAHGLQVFIKSIVHVDFKARAVMVVIGIGVELATGQCAGGNNTKNQHK